MIFIMTVEMLSNHSNTAFFSQVGQLLREALTKRDPAKILARRKRRRARAEKARGTTSPTDQIPRGSLRGELPDPRRQELFDDIDFSGSHTLESKPSPIGAAQSNSQTKSRHENT